jgi:uncharacterized secreted protein with C-terminal beta-propeller domain
MKKFLIFMMLAFSVVMYASPPPVPEVITEQVQFSPPGEFQTIQAVEVQEVAYVYLGDFEMASYQEFIIEPVAKLEFPVMVMNDNYFAFAQELNKPPSILNLNGAINKQHSNYGYPFTAN